ncbi:MAG: TlpA family protein disulfide reductase [Ignavibacteriae bacterium]|nr:TlpA family protein disulfide reductase [Ignavibacteriota bacterium]MCB0724118.1 TlpA family protein disulfide reductase [Ignavibacteriota bacterium]MCB9243838.1 TlpA family protein disulfide reductase [Ignavibacteriales bacterium]
MKKLAFLAIILSFFFVNSAKSQSYYNFTLQDLDGNDVSLDELVAKGPVFLSFWATWCSPCKEEMKYLQDIYNKYKDKGFTYLAVNTDSQKSLSKVKTYISSKGYTFPVVLDTDEKIFEAYLGEGLPYSLLIGTDKKISSKHVGFLPGDEEKIEKEVVELLPSGNSESMDK